MSEQAEAETEELVENTAEQPQEQDAVDELLDGVEQSEPDAVSDAGETESESQGEEEDDPWAEALAEQLEEESADTAAAPADNGGKSYSPAPLDPLENESSSGSGKEVDLDLVLDIPVTIAMEIGRTKINVRNLLQLNQGSVVELDRLAGEPLDVMVNGTLIAHGEVVVVNEKFGIRLTDVVSAQERLKNLKK